MTRWPNSGCGYTRESVSVFSSCRGDRPVGEALGEIAQQVADADAGRARGAGGDLPDQGRLVGRITDREDLHVQGLGFLGGGRFGRFGSSALVSDFLRVNRACDHPEDDRVWVDLGIGPGEIDLVDPLAPGGRSVPPRPAWRWDCPTGSPPAPATGSVISLIRAKAASAIAIERPRTNSTTAKARCMETLLDLLHRGESYAVLTDYKTGQDGKSFLHQSVCRKTTPQVYVFWKHTSKEWDKSRVSHLTRRINGPTTTAGE